MRLSKPSGYISDSCEMESPEKKHKPHAVNGNVSSEDRLRLRELVEQGALLHPCGSTSSFADLAQGLALCCGLTPERCVRQDQARKFAREIGGTERRHIVVVLCDGMGCTVLEQHLGPESFLRRNNDEDRLVAIFPATTPAALCTLATGVWPGQHGFPGWDLRDQKGCEFPGVPTRGVVQIRVLHPHVADLRSMRRLKELDPAWTDKDIFVATPWTARGKSKRRMSFCNAYNKDEFPSWYRGPHVQPHDLYTFPETVLSTLGTPEGSKDAVSFARAGVDAILERVTLAEKEGVNSYTYMYTSHPDKHMHALGVEHEEVHNVMLGLDKEFERLWAGLRNYDTTLVMTADHSHITVQPDDMVELPSSILDCLEYANIGVHGKGRHGCLHVRSGRFGEFERLWSESSVLRQKFLLLTIEDAIAEGLFGPDPPVPSVRPRLGDFIALSLGAGTLVTPAEAKTYRDCDAPRCQGAHGSLCRQDLSIPFILCRSDEPPKNNLRASEPQNKSAIASSAMNQ